MFVVSTCRAMENTDYGNESRTTMESDSLFPLFKGFFFPFFFFFFFDKAQEIVSDMLVGTYGKEYTLYQWCSSYPKSCVGGCGNSVLSVCAVAMR